VPNISLARQSTFVGANPFLQDSKDFGSNNGVLVTCNDARNRRGLSFDTCRALFNDHTARFVLSASASCCKPHHAKRNDILCVETKLHSLEGQRGPWIKQETPNVGDRLSFLNSSVKGLGKRHLTPTGSEVLSDSR
jgi:hypothetical protein